MQIVDADGRPTFSLDRLIGSASADRLTPRGGRGTAQGGDEFIVVWTAPDFNQTGVFLQKFDAEGNALTGPLQVNTIEAGFQNEASIEILDTGGRGSSPSRLGTMSISVYL